MTVELATWYAPVYYMIRVLADAMTPSAGTRHGVLMPAATRVG